MSRGGLEGEETRRGAVRAALARSKRARACEENGSFDREWATMRRENAGQMLMPRLFRAVMRWPDARPRVIIIFPFELSRRRPGSLLPRRSVETIVNKSRPVM